MLLILQYILQPRRGTAKSDIQELGYVLLAGFPDRWFPDYKLWPSLAVLGAACLCAARKALDFKWPMLRQAVNLYCIHGR